jgi:hypothetical protein
MNIYVDGIPNTIGLLLVALMTIFIALYLIVPVSWCPYCVSTTQIRETLDRHKVNCKDKDMVIQILTEENFYLKRLKERN